MTESERHQKISTALIGVAALLDELAKLGLKAEKRSAQLAQLSREFGEGRYLPKDDPLPDDTDADPEASPA